MLRGIVFSALTVLALNSAPAEAFRCGNRIVSEGDDISRVHHFCGEPDATRYWTEVRVRSVYRYRSRHHRDSGLYGIDVPVEIQVEEWTYNFGNRRFMRRLRFENGLLVEIRALRYGY